MAILPKQIQELRDKRAQLKKDREERLALESANPEVINNAVTEDQKPQGQQKLGSLILKQGQKLSKFIIPLATNLLKQYAIDKVKEEIDAKQLSPEELKAKFCPTNLQDIIKKRNNAVEFLNKTGDRLDSLSITVDFGANFASLLQGLITGLKTTKTIATQVLSFIPLTPGAAVSAIDTVGDIVDSLTFNADGTPKIPPIKITASQVSPAVALVQDTILKCVDLLGRLDILINLCDSNSNLIPLSDSIQQVVAIDSLAKISQNKTTYKGFVIEIETKPYTDRVNQNRAVGKNNSGIVMISTEYSFASDPQVLITELKFIIDRDDLKAY